MFYLTFLSGMSIASLAFISAGCVELKRINTNATVVNFISRRNVIANDISIWYQIPQYALIGISEIFVLMTGESLKIFGDREIRHLLPARNVG